MDAAISMGINTIYYDDYAQSNKRAPLVKQVNRRDVQRLANDLFSSSQLMIFTSNLKWSNNATGLFKPS